MEMIVIRGIPRKTCVISSLFIDEAQLPECLVLEDIPREVAGEAVTSWKIKDVTAIPKGRYAVVVTDSIHFGKKLPELLKVPGYTGVRIHSGNTALDTEGCLLIGEARGLGGESVINSRIAFAKLFAKIEAALAAGEEVWITIK